jgi:hypothetical protein
MTLMEAMTNKSLKRKLLRGSHYNMQTAGKFHHSHNIGSVINIDGAFWLVEYTAIDAVVIRDSEGRADGRQAVLFGYCRKLKNKEVEQAQRKYALADELRILKLDKDELIHKAGVNACHLGKPAELQAKYEERERIEARIAELQQQLAAMSAK